MRQDNLLQMFYGLRREELFSGMRINACRYILYNEELAVFKQGVGDTFLHQIFFVGLGRHHAAIISL